MPASYIPEIKEVKGKPSEIMKGDFELTGLIDETFGTHQYFGVVDETEVSYKCSTIVHIQSFKVLTFHHSIAAVPTCLVR